MIDKNESELLLKSAKEASCAVQLTDIKYNGLHHWFEANAIKHPDRIAIVHNSASITYLELNQRANQISHYIKNTFQDIANRPICIYLPSSISFVIAKLAVLKAGAAYVPLDIKYPIGRIRNIMASTGSPIVFTDTQHLDFLSDLDKAALDIEHSSLYDGYSTINPEVYCSENDLAYLIFTSGSTGEPKGVCIEHRNILNLMYWSHRFYDMHGGENAVQTTRLVFDASVWEFWMHLLAGNTIFIVDQVILLDLDKFNYFMHESKINYALLPTPIAEIFMQGDRALNSELKDLMIGGDRLITRPGIDFGARVTNLYGPAECTVIATAKVVESQSELHRNPSIGKQIDNCNVYILDENLRQVEIGQIGEIYIGGKCVGAGYWNRDDLTEAAFFSDPFSHERAAIMYKTGDLGRFYPDGDIDFIGRIDTQVKMRGFRIELSEIETVILQHPAIHECVVLAHDSGSQDKSLAGYYSLKKSYSVTTDEVRAYAQSKLAEYMVPSYLKQMDEMPLTENGKIDRKALPKPDIEVVREYIAPQSAIEIQVADIWKSVIKLDQISMTDRFYAIGGHSLKATQIISKLRSELDVEIDIVYMLNNPSLAECIESITSNTMSIRETIPIGDHDAPYPLAWAQHGMWYYWKLDPGRIDYNIPLRIDFRGEIDTSRLQKTINLMIERHYVLRTSFTMVDGVPMAKVLPVRDLPMTYTKLQELPSPKEIDPLDSFKAVLPYPVDDNRLNAIRNQMANVVFDLKAGYLHRWHLVECDHLNYVLFITIHHIITDGWSMGVFIRDLRAIYDSLGENGESLAKMEVQYSDFAHWQKHIAPAEKYPEQLEYWKEKLLPLPPSIHLQAGKGASTDNKHSGDRVWWKLNKKVARYLRKLAADEGKSLFSILLAIYKLLVSKYTGETDIVIGSSYAGRDVSGTENLMGLFTNLLALRTQLDPDISFKTLLSLVHETTTSAFANSDYPFDQLIKDIGYKASGNQHPIFNAIFVLQNFPIDLTDQDGLSMEFLEMGNGTSKFDLLLTVEEWHEDLICWFEYNTDNIDREIAQNMARHFSELARLICKDPELTLKEYDPLSSSEKATILYDWNSTYRDFPLDKNYIDLFRNVVAYNPEAIAVKCEDGELSYRDLEHKSNLLAYQLINQGVLPGKVIGITLSRKTYLPISILAIWKMGCCYLPLDQDFPKERIQYMLEDSAVTLIITESNFTSIFPSTYQSFVIDTVDYSDATECSLAQPLSDTTAYIIYTSGSTGKPKGVMISHKNLINHNYAVIEEFGLSKTDRVLQFGSISFDLSVEEIFPTLLAGACVVFRTDRVMDSLEYFIEFVQREEISVIDVPTAYWHELVYVLEYTKLPSSVRLCIIGGEKALKERLNLWQKHVDSHVRLLNTYGPTEATIIATVYEPSIEDKVLDSFPIGKALANTQIYILNSQLHPLPVGTAGELYIGGRGVSQGYVNNPQLTQERFVENIFTQDSSQMYRTGDLASFDPAGNIHYVGRVDNQIKLLGHRIELSEIEHHLVTIESVKDAVVVFVDDNPDQQYLCAYLVLNKPIEDFSQIKTILGKIVPDYMVPAQMINIAEIPLTTQGKLDKRSLPKPDFKQQYVQISLPETPTEQLIYPIWTKVLGIEQCDTKASFMDMGGHSLKAMLMVSLLEKNIGKSISLKSFLDNQTIKALGKCLDSIESVSSNQAYNVIDAVDREQDSYPMSFAQEGLWFLWELDDTKISYNIPMCYSIHGYLNTEVLNHAYQLMVSRHEVFKTRFIQADDKARVVLDFVPEQTIDLIDLSSLPETIALAKAAYLAKQIAATKMDLMKGPLFVLRLIKISDDMWYLVLVIHHIVADGWSFAVFSKEIFEFYRDLLLEIDIVNMPLKIQSVDYAEWQQSPGPQSGISRQSSYWSQQLSPLPEPLNLPYIGVRPSFQTYTGSQIRFEVSSERLNKWQEAGNKHEVSLFMMLLCGLNILYYKYSNQNDIIIGSPFANRKDSRLDNILGCFTNMLPLRVLIQADLPIRDLLKMVKDTCLEAYENSDYPFHLMPSLINLPRDTSRHPIYQIMLTLQNYETYDLVIPGLNISTDMIANGSAKLDMSWDFAVDETGLHGVLEYNSSLFTDSLCNRMLSNLLTIMDEISVNVNNSINAMEAISSNEISKLLYSFNQTDVSPVPYNSVTEWILNQCIAFPDKTALRFGDYRYSYKMLAAEVSELSTRLTKQGIKQGDRIGIYLDRCPQMLFSCIAVWIVGASFLYLDSEFPEDRLNFMIDDADVKLIITASTVPFKAANYEVLFIDKYTNTPSDIHVVSQCDLDSEAYVIFTSGSTGKPKGVQISHKSLLNFLNAMKNNPGITGNDVLAAITPLSFDISMLEMFLPLVSGAELLILPRAKAIDANLLAELIESEDVTIFQATPSTFKMLIDSAWRGKQDLKLLCGGEALPKPLAIELTSRSAELWNMYGPTETTVWSCIYQIKDDSVLIGKPIDNTEVYVLNPSMAPTPWGAWGELYIGGSGLAMGYLKREELTLQKFIPNPFVIGEKLYQTGDLVRWTENEFLEYGGRNDFQVKINGHRIELEEIANHLRALESVKDAVVVVRETKSAQKMLVAYIIQANAEQTEEYIRILAHDLPDYMVPRNYVYLDSFPLTANGKIDIKELPAPALDLDSQKRQLLAPVTPEQEILCKAVAEILSINEVSITDNFFDLGGNSILTMKLINTIHKSGLSITVDQIFHHKTLEELAATMQIRRTEKNAFGSESLIVLQKGKIGSRPLFLVHPLPGDVLGYVNLVKHLSPDITIYGFQALGLSDPSHLHRSIPSMAKYYLEIIKEMNLDGFYLGGWCYGGSIAVEMAKQMGNDCKQIPYVFLFDTWAFNPQKAMWLPYLIHRMKVALFNWRRIPHLIRTKLKERRGFQVIFDQTNIFQDQGIFSNRSLVRKANLNSLYSWKMDKFECNLVLFKAKEQHPDTLHDWSLGWKIFAKNMVVHDFDTTHDNILKEPAVNEVASTLGNYLVKD